MAFVAFMVAGRYAHYDGTLPIWNSLESPGFLEQFGRLVERVPSGAVALNSDPSPLGRLGAASFAATDLLMRDLDGAPQRFIAESFFNQYSVFLMLTLARARRGGRRQRAAKTDSGDHPD